MATSKVLYKGDLRTELTHILSNNLVVTDAPLDNNGKGQAFSPTDLMSTSLASCILTIMGIYAQRENIDIANASAEVSKIMSNEGPRRVVKIKIDFVFPTNNYSEKHKKALIQCAKTCPVALSLHPDIEQVISFEFP
jgi:putative redox protein